MSVNNKEFSTVRELVELATVRGKSYLDDCEKFGEHGVIGEEPVIFFTQKAHRILREKWREHDARMGLGDLVHSVAGKVGQFIHWPCNKRVNGVVTNELTPGSPCDKMRTRLNKIKVP